jgi:cell division protein FtsB
MAWTGLNPEARQQDLASMANKVLIALLSYIPISLARSILVNRQISRQRREMHREIEGLKRRLEELERKSGQGA